MATFRIRENDVVHVSRLAGTWRVLSIGVSTRSHSAIPVFDAVVEPIGERWVRTPRVVLYSELTPAPPDIEDFPCSPV